MKQTVENYTFPRCKCKRVTRLQNNIKNVPLLKLIIIDCPKMDEENKRKDEKYL